MPKFVLMDREDPMSTICRMAVNTGYEDLPKDVINFAKQCILDQMAVTIGGSSLETIAAIVDFVKDKGGKQETIIPFYGGKVPASQAGFAIGPMARAMDFGMEHEEAGHPAEFVLPSLLAATGLKRKISGKEFITAFVIGQEVFIRIGIAAQSMSRGMRIGRGHGHSIFGPVAAVGKLLGLGQEDLENAQGMASEMCQPFSIAMYSAGSLIIRVHHGFVCQDAINCCLLAQIGMTGPRQGVLAAPKGYLGYAKWETKPEALTDDLGEKWEMLNVMLKPYPCCKATHTTNYGLIEQMKKYNFTAEDIAQIHIDAGSDPTWTIVCIPQEEKWNPHTAHECQFSLAYTTAIAAYDGEITLESFSPEARKRPEVRELMTRISASEDSSFPHWAVRVHTTLKDGRKYSDEVLYAKGHPNIPFTEPELIKKFKACVPYCAHKLSDRAVDSIVNTLLHLEAVDDVASALILPLTPV